MAYTKPQVIAQNASSGSYAAGCPEYYYKTQTGWEPGQPFCASCERAK